MPRGLCRFGVLGSLALERDGEHVPLPRGRQRSLLALLLSSGGTPLSRDRLIDELWGEHPPAAAVSALHVYLSKLRELLDGLLVLEPAGYQLTLGGYELDVWHFDALVEQARADSEHARPLLREALKLFRGDPLSDVAAEGSVALWRRELEEKRLRATMLRLEADLAAGAAVELVPELEQLLAQHPLEERLWTQLMIALYRAGRQADALDAYQRARQLFASELGLDPGKPLALLQQRILERDPALLLSEQAPTGAPPVRTPSNLPRPATRLVGRERELADLVELTADPDARILTLIGPGGVGKTRLALELARLLEDQYADGVVLVRLERLTEPELVTAEIATVLAGRDGTDGPSADGLATYLHERELLLIIDNFEQLLSAAPMIADLVAAAAGIRVVVTSRIGLRIRGEATFEVQPLGLPEGESERAVRQSPAVQLFVQLATARNRQLELGADATRTVAHICWALDGLPLAIELAASRSHLLTPEQIAEQLAQPLTIGEHALRDLPDRQQTLAATIRWSYDLLTPTAREVLCCAAVFRGGFTLPALEAVTCGPVRAPIDELREASLVRSQLEAGRFELLELVRAFALEELQDSTQASQARARHRRHFAAQVATASEAFDDGGAPGELAAPLLADHANLREAFDDALRSGDQNSAVALALGMRPLWLAGMLRQEAQELLTRLLKAFVLPGTQEVALLRAVVFLDYRPSAKFWHRRLAVRAAEIGDHETVAVATGNLFGVALNTRDLDEMRRLQPELLGLITPQASAKSLGWIHYYLALGAYVDGRYESGFEHASLSVENAAAIGHEYMLGSAAGTRLLLQSARDAVITHAALAEALELMGRPSIAPLAAVALWLVARYAAGVAPETAGRWLAQAERIVAPLDADLWPESVLRAETIVVLGIDGLGSLFDETPPLDHAAALAEAAAWLAGRDATERAPRSPIARLSSSGSG